MKKLFKLIGKWIGELIGKWVVSPINIVVCWLSTFLSWLAAIVVIVLIIGCFVLMVVDMNISEMFKSMIEYFHLANSGCWDWIAVGVASISLFYACMTFNSQRQTELNTMKITPESQRSLLLDYVRHFYADLIVISAIEHKLNDRFDEYYPSEEHLLKLKADLDALHPATFYDHAEKYSAIHNLLLLLRNFNLEVDVAIKHLCDRNVFDRAKKRDINTLKFKTSLIAQRTIETIVKIWGNEDALKAGIRCDLQEIYVKRNESKSKESKECKEKKESKDYLDEAKKCLDGSTDPYCFYNNRDSYWAKLFDAENGQEDFFKWLNYNIYVEINGRNGEGSEKIMLIPFDKNRVNFFDYLSLKICDARQSESECGSNLVSVDSPLPSIGSEIFY